MNKAVNLRIADLRRARHITQNELAQAVGTTFQNVSKWENSITMPDISMLPLLADYFEVSVDELLGLKPLKNEKYSSEETDTAKFWDSHSDYIRSKIEGWNDDYIGFLVREVWKLRIPVSVLDCGCGNARFAPLFMKHLPGGSSYTGIDFSSVLIAHAKTLLKQHNIRGEIIEGDFLKSNLKGFNVVLCQSVLRHIGDSKAFIAKMAGSAADGGLIICIDTNRELESCGLYIDGMDYGELCGHSGAIKHWKAELENSQRDYAAAMRSAYIMRELGLSDIGIRMNDRVSFICPEQKDHNQKINDFISSKNLWYSDIGEAAERLVNHGMTRSEAESYADRNHKICEYLKKHKESAALTQFQGKTITYGWKGGKNFG